MAKPPEGGPVPGPYDIPTPGPQGISRRRAIGLTGAGVGLLGLGGLGGWALRDSTVEPPRPPEVRWRNGFDAPFNLPEANEAARRYGITAGTFFEQTPDAIRGVTDAISATPDNVLHSNAIPPVLVPGAGANVRWINQILDDVPGVTRQEDGRTIHMPRIIPAVAHTIETGGDLKDISPDLAIGPMQVVAKEHFDKLVSAAETVDRPLGISRADVNRWRDLIDDGKKTEATDFMNSLGKQVEITEALQDPFVGMMTGIMVLNEYRAHALAKVRETKPDIDPNHMDVWTLALAVYNGGFERLKQPFDQWPDETKKYVMNALGFLVSAEVAHQVQQRVPGKDTELGVVSAAQAVRSTDVDARAWAFNETRHNWNPAHVLTVLSTRDLEVPPDPQTGQPVVHPTLVADVKRNHEQYLTAKFSGGTDLFPRKLPLSAGARRWVNQGDGLTLLEGVRDNLQPSKYAANW